MIREITPADESSLARFFSENDCAEVTRFFHPFPLDAESARRIAREPRKDRYFAFWEDESIVGLAMLRGWDEGYEVPSFGIAVDHRYQGQGIGRQLTEHALTESQRLGCPRVRLTVYESNTKARPWYERLGFRACSREPQSNGDARIVMIREFIHE